MRQLFFSCSMRQQAFKRATVIDLRGRYDSARKERFRLSRDDQVIAKAYFSWPPLEESGHMIVSVDRHMRRHQIRRILSSAQRQPQMGPRITWQASQLILWKCVLLKKWLPTWTAYRSLPFQPFPPEPPFETIPADGRQPVNAVHSLLASNTDLPVTIYNHPTSL